MDHQASGLDLEKELQCSICTELLYQPLTLLDCLHTFCGSCLKEWFAWQGTRAENAPTPPPPDAPIFTCPSCRAGVRDTKHNATVATLLEMYLGTHPEKARSDTEKEEIAVKYKAGDSVLPKLKIQKKSERQRRLDEEDRRLMEEVRAISLREAGVEPSSSQPRRRRDESRSRDHQPSRSRDHSRDPRTRRESRDRRRSEEGRRHRSGLQPESSGSGDERRRPRGESMRLSNDTANLQDRHVEHQASLRSLIALDSDTQREVEELSRQILEEGILDGLDLDNIDLSQDSELSRRIIEAYRRRQKGRSRIEPTRRSNASGMSRQSDPNQTEPVRLRPVEVSRPTSRHTIHSRTPSSTSQSDERSRPPISNNSTYLDVRGDQDRRRRRRAVSETRSVTDPIRPSVVDARPAIRSTTDLPTPIRRASASSSTRPTVSELRGSTFPTMTTPDSTPANHLPFSTRIQSKPHEQQQQQQQQPTTGQSAESSAGPARPKRSSRPSDISVPPSNTVETPQASPRLGVSEGGSSYSSSQQLHPIYRAHLWQEPSITCSGCHKPHIEYDLHFNCATCDDGRWNLCVGCYRGRKGCRHWFGFGREAQVKWERRRTETGDNNLAPPHILAAYRYQRPQGATTVDGRRVLSSEDPSARLQSGNFCVRCFAWSNDCYWQCFECNWGNWGFCNDCVNTGHGCSHPLLPLVYWPSPSSSPVHTSSATSPPPSPSPRTTTTPAGATVMPGPHGFGAYKPLVFKTTCDLCRAAIQPHDRRLHCYTCTSALVSPASAGDYDICTTCYRELEESGRISRENGRDGWRRCPQGHRMSVIAFAENKYGQWRNVVQEVVGGFRLYREEVASEQQGMGMEQWCWAEEDGEYVRTMVTKDVAAATGRGPGALPPDGGKGPRAVALWAYYPKKEATDELMFPKGAEISEVTFDNESWAFGVYMGNRGLFPIAYVRAP